MFAAVARSNPLCFALSPVALAIVFWYSLAKRYTTWTQLFLGLAMAVAPVGGWLAVGGRGGWEPWLLALAIGTWVGGFDVLYACQDLDFDRAHGLRSIPVRFGVPAVARDLARRCTSSPSSCLLALRAGRRRSARCTSPASALVAALLVYEQSLVQRRRPVAGEARVRPERLRRHPLSRSCWRRPSMSAEPTAPSVAVAITGASGAIYAVRTLAALLARGVARRAHRHPTTAVACCATSSARRRRSSGSMPYLTAKYGAGRERGQRDAAQQPRSRRDDRQRQPRLRRAWSIVPCSMKTLAGVAHGLSRNLVERAADVMLKERRRLVIVPRETPMSLPQLRNMVLCAEAGAMMLPAMPAFYQLPKTLDDLADFMAGKILERARLRARRSTRRGQG